MAGGPEEGLSLRTVQKPLSWGLPVWTKEGGALAHVVCPSHCTRGPFSSVLGVSPWSFDSGEEGEAQRGEVICPR